MRRLWFGLLFFGLAVSAVAGAALPLQLKPTSKWNVDYAKESCRLTRQFGDGDQRLVLVLESYQPGNDLHAMFIGDVLAQLKLMSRQTASLRFGPNEAAQEVRLLPASAAQLSTLVVAHRVRIVPISESDLARAAKAHRGTYPNFDPAIDPAREAAVTSLEILVGKSPSLVLLTGPMQKPMAALQKCAWDTVASWGLDVEQQKSLSRPPARLKTPILKPEDYPEKLVDGGYEAIIHSRLMIDATGKPTACVMQRSTRPKELDDKLCQSFLQRARFEPALDARGMPVPSFFTFSAQFRLR